MKMNFTYKVFEKGVELQRQISRGVVENNANFG